MSEASRQFDVEIAAVIQRARQENPELTVGEVVATLAFHQFEILAREREQAILDGDREKGKG